MRSWFVLLLLIPNFLQAQTNWEEYLTEGLAQAQAYYQADSLEQAISSATALVDEMASKLSEPSPAMGNVLHKLGVYHYVNNDYESAQQFYQKAIEERRKALGEKHLDLSRSYHNLGVALKEKGNFQAAIRNLFEAVNIRREHEAPGLLATSYQELGIVHGREGDYAKSIEYYQTALNLFAGDKPSYDLARTLQAIGIIYRKMGEYDKALENLELSNKYFIELYGRIDPDVADCYNNLGNVYGDAGQSKKALEQYEYSLQINQQLYPGGHISIAQNFSNIGYAMVTMGAYYKGQEFYNRSLEMRKALYGERSTRLAIVYENLGSVNATIGRVEEALEFYQKALQQNLDGFTPNTIYDHPDLSKHQIIGNRLELLHQMQVRANTYYQLYTQTNALKDIESALESYRLCDAMITELQQGYQSADSKLFLLKQVKAIYEDALQVVFNLLEIESKEEYLQQAFHFMEKSKSVLLLARLRENEAIHFAEIPEALIHQENDFKADLEYLERRLLNQQQPDSKLQATLVDRKQQYQDFLLELEQQYPRYFQAKHKTEMADLDALQQYLRETNSGFAEYLYGEKAIYFFLVTGDEKRLMRLITFPDLTGLIREFLEWNDDFPQNAYALGKSIWPGIDIKLPERMIVIPDGPIAYVPFSALLAAERSDKKYRTYPYLLHMHQFSYAYSATILLENVKEGKASYSKPFLGVAPVYAESSSFDPLTFSEEEVHHIRKAIGGQILVGANATKEAFKAQAGAYQVLHISSHAQAEDQARQLSWIGFSDQDQTEEANYKLYLSELSNMDLGAEMAVLSACETGTGQLSEGEGVMSLARGFAYAGCQSITTTLWSVNHASTNYIMQAFYEGIQDGLDKDAALRQAKIAYLEDPTTDHAGAHPYYWAAYVHLGDRDALELKRSNWIWYALPVAGLILLLFLGRKRIFRS